MATKKQMIKEAEQKLGRKIPAQYVPLSLSKKDLEKQLQSIIKGKPRPFVKTFKSRTSSWTDKMKRYFGEGNTSKEDVARILSKGNKKRERQIKKGLDEIFDKGMEAYRTSGSRPNQTPFSWAYARIGSVLFGGKSRNVDKAIVEKYDLPLLK